MAISSKSYIHKPADYVTPVDLNLLGRVLQFKQAQYDSGVSKVQSNIDALASMDVVKDVDRDYLNSKINNLVMEANNIGGVDFSDPNITNQIAGLSSQIYSDDKVITAVANTKKFRYVQKHYTDLKEKKPKEWNPANEWYDMNKFSGWLSDGQVGTSAENGAGSVTPYQKYDEDWQKLFDKITSSANISTDITDKGLMYRIDTHKVVSPERIWEVASKMLTPAQRQQLAIEGRYQYQNLPISELTKQYDAETYSKVANATSELNDYKTKYKGATSIEDQEKYEQLISEKESEINGLIAPVRKNSDQIKESIYLGEKLKGLQARYAFSQSSTKLQAAADKMFKAKYEQENYQFNVEQQGKQMDRAIEMADKGLMYATDPLTGQTTIVRDPNWKPRKGSGSGKDGEVDYSTLPGMSSSMEEQTMQFSEDKMIQRKTDLTNSNKELFQKFVQQLGRKKGFTDVIVTDLMDDGRLQTKVPAEIQKAAQEMMASWNAMTRGEKINYDQLDPLFKNFASQYQENLKEIEAMDTFTTKIDKQIMGEYGVTPEMMDKYNRFQEAQRRLQQSRGQSAHAGAGSTAMFEQNKKRAEEQYNQEVQALGGNTFGGIPGINFKNIQAYLKDRKDKKTSYINAANVRFNLPNVTTTDDKNKNLAKMIAGNASTTQWYNSEGVPQGKGDINFENVDVQSKGYTYVEGDGGAMVKQPSITFKYKTGSGAEDFEVRRVILNPQQAQQLGFGTDVKDLKGYRLGLHMNGEVNGINTSSGRAYDLKYDVVKYNPDDQNDETVFVRVQKGNNKISLYNMPFLSVEQAQQFMETQTRYKTIEEAMQHLADVSK